MKKYLLMMVLPLLLALTGCDVVKEGHVGVKEHWGKINKKETGVGVQFYNPITTSLTSYNVQEIPVELDNLTPKAGDNLSLADFDVTVYYTPYADQVAETVSSYAQSTGNAGGGELYPAYKLVYKLARDAAYSAIGAQTNSLVVNKNREEIKTHMLKSLSVASSNKWGDVSRIIIRSIKTDPSVEESIRDAVDAKNRLIAMDAKEDIAKKKGNIKVIEARAIAKANKIINGSLTVEYLQHEQNMAIQAGLAKGANTVVIPANMSGMMLNLGNTR